MSYQLYISQMLPICHFFSFPNLMVAIKFATKFVYRKPLVGPFPLISHNDIEIANSIFKLEDRLNKSLFQVEESVKKMTIFLLTWDGFPVFYETMFDAGVTCMYEL